MKRIAINSGVFLSVGYDAELQVLEIEFSDRSVYQFVRVTAEVYALFMQSTDKQKYFEQFIQWQYAGQCLST